VSDAQVFREMCRCTRCYRWWSVLRDDVRKEVCSCGGSLTVIDMMKYVSSVTAAPTRECSSCKDFITMELSGKLHAHTVMKDGKYTTCPGTGSR